MGEVKSFMFLPLAAPALPLDEAGKYVAGAYIVFLVLIVIYVAIMATKVQRIEKELRELAGFVENRANGEVVTPGGRGNQVATSSASGPGAARGDDAV